MSIKNSSKQHMQQENLPTLHILNSGWVPRCSEKTKRFITDAILKMRPIHRQTVLNGQRFSRQFQKDRKNLLPSLLSAAIHKVIPVTTVRHAGYAGR